MNDITKTCANTTTDQPQEDANERIAVKDREELVPSMADETMEEVGLESVPFVGFVNSKAWLNDVLVLQNAEETILDPAREWVTLSELSGHVLDTSKCMI